MKNILKKTHVPLLALAIVLSVAIVRTSTQQSVSPCLETPGCTPTDITKNTGTLTTKTFGYPLAVQQRKKFYPTDKSRYVETTIETQSFSVISAVINTVFWFALLDSVLRLALRYRHSHHRTHS